MINELFLVCALSLPATHFTRPPIVHYFAESNEEEKLKEWLRKHNEIDDVFITPRGSAEDLRRHGWERVPFTIHDKEIWIQRKPKSDAKQRRMETSA